MEVLLLRHGVAEDGKPGTDDAGRALTRDGRAKLRLLLEQVAAAKVVPALILSSPLLRAVQTAEVAARVLGYRGEILQTRALEPGSSPEAIWDEIRAHRDSPSLLLVGHNPLFSHAAAFLLDSPHLQIDFKKGAPLKVEFQGFPSRPSGILRWYLTPKLTRSKD